MDKQIRIALAGNPNSGKTTLFNKLTGSNQFVGNWPGVTVEKKEGKLIVDKEVILTDLPGIYSLSPYTLEEVVARNYLMEEKPDAILNIVDATNLERNLYLTTPLTELGIPVVIALNMMDLVKKAGDSINVKELSRQPSCRESSFTLMLSPAFLTRSIMLRAMTTGMPSSVSWVVRYRLRSRLVASTMFKMASGFSSMR